MIVRVQKLKQTAFTDSLFVEFLQKIFMFRSHLRHPIYAMNFKNGFSALEVLTPEEKEKYFEIYRKLPSYNPDVSPEEFFRGMDSGFLGIYPKNTPDIVKAIDSIKVPDEDVIKTVASDAEELQKTKPVELDELSEETKFRIYKLIVNEIGKHFYNCEMRMSYKDFILVEDCIRKVLQGEQDEHKTD